VPGKAVAAGEPAGEPAPLLPGLYAPGTGVGERPGDGDRPVGEGECEAPSCAEGPPEPPGMVRIMAAATTIVMAINAQNIVNFDIFASIDVYFTSYYGKYLLLDKCTYLHRSGME